MLRPEAPAAPLRLRGLRDPRDPRDLRDPLPGPGGCETPTGGHAWGSVPGHSFAAYIYISGAGGEYMYILISGHIYVHVGIGMCAYMCACARSHGEAPTPGYRPRRGRQRAGEGGWGRGWGGRLGSGVSLREGIWGWGGGGCKRPAPATPKLPQPPRRVDKSRLFADGEAGLERGGGLKLGVSEGTGWGLQPGVPRFEAVAMVGAGEAPPGMSG